MSVCIIIIQLTILLSPIILLHYSTGIKIIPVAIDLYPQIADFETILIIIPFSSFHLPAIQFTVAAIISAIISAVISAVISAIVPGTFHQEIDIHICANPIHSSIIRTLPHHIFFCISTLTVVLGYPFWQGIIIRICQL